MSKAQLIALNARVETQVRLGNALTKHHEEKLAEEEAQIAKKNLEKLKADPQGIEKLARRISGWN